MNEEVCVWMMMGVGDVDDDVWSRRMRCERGGLYVDDGRVSEVDDVEVR